MIISKTLLMSAPHDAVAVLRQLLPAITGAVVATHGCEHVIIDLRLTPPFELTAHDYPVEPMRIVCFADAIASDPYAIPLRDEPVWEHRYPSVDREAQSGSLCLWYPRDPARLRWTWRLGLEGFVQLAHRHLLAEERCRRGFPWPWPDAPHGERADGRPHPLRPDRRAS